MIWVINAHYIKDYQIGVQFNDSMEGIVNLKDLVFYDRREIFNQLQDIESFRSLKVDMDTIVWSNGADLALEYLYDKVLEKE